MQINRIDGLSHVVCAGNCWNACPLPALPKAAGGPGLFSTGGWLQPTPLFALCSRSNLPPDRFPRLWAVCMHDASLLKRLGTFQSFLSCMYLQAPSPTCSVGEQHNMDLQSPRFPASYLQPSLNPFATNKGLDQSKIQPG